MKLSRFMNQSLSFVSSCALKCAAELQISNHIKEYGGPMPVHELACTIPIPPEKELMLDQLMELLVHQGVYAKCEAGYLLTPISELMLNEGSNMGVLVCSITELFAKHFFFLGKWFKNTNTGTVFQLAHDGKQIWDVLKEKPEHGNLFNEAMASQSKELGRDFVANYPEIFDGVNNLVDVGGGTGTTVKMIADSFPRLRCTLFDLPRVVENTLTNDSFSVVGGDMFDKIPPADAILLKNVLHNWPDEACVQILKRCKEAIESTTHNRKVIVLDLVLDTELDNLKATETNLFYNLLMLSSAGGKERTEKEWNDVILGAGYSDYKIYPGQMPLYSVIELYP